jgi:hypothetical protein
MKKKIISLILFSFSFFIVLFISVKGSEKISLAQVSENDSFYVPESVLILLKGDLENILQEDLRIKEYGADEERALLKDIAAAEKGILKTNILIIEQNNKIIYLLRQLNNKK